MTHSLPVPGKELAQEKAAELLHEAANWYEVNSPNTALPYLTEAASALGLHVSAQPAAQQPSDLVKRLREFNTAYDSKRHILEAADRIEALEADQKSLRLHIAELTEQLDIAKAAAAQPSREAALVRALEAISCGQYPEAQNIERTGHYFEAFKAVQEIASEALAAYDTTAKEEK